MKLNKNKATLMTEDCLFYDVKTFNGMYEGMEICFNNMDILKRRNTFINNKYVQAACFVFVIFCSYLFLSFYQENIATYAYVGIDINPSIEIALNKKGVILQARGLDEDGKKLLEQISIEKKSSIDGIKEIIEKTIDMGYLAQEKSNQINVYTVMEKRSYTNGDEIAQRIRKAINEEVSSHKINGDIKTLVSDIEAKNEADKMGISITKYIEEQSKATNSKQSIDGEKVLEVTKNKTNKEDSEKDNKNLKNKKDKVDKDKDKDKDKNDSNKHEDTKGRDNRIKQKNDSKNTGKGYNKQK